MLLCGIAEMLEQVMDDAGIEELRGYSLVLQVKRLIACSTFLSRQTVVLKASALIPKHSWLVPSLST